jgi:hypothetical protein
MSNLLPQGIQDALLSAGLEPVDPSSDETDQAREEGTHVLIGGPTNDQDLDVLLADAVTFAGAIQGLDPALYTSVSFPFRRVATGQYLVLTVSVQTE